MNACQIDTGHSKCHSQETHWCESPVIKKRVSSCDDGCCTITSTTIDNMHELKQYVNGVYNEHQGYPTLGYIAPIGHNLGRTLADLSGNSSCGSYVEPTCTTGPALHFNEINCGTREYDRCCSPYYGMVRAQAINLRGRGGCSPYTYGDVPVMIKEVPAIGLFIVNYEFIDLCVDEIRGCLPTQNVCHTTCVKVREYVDYYYKYYNAIDNVGTISLDETVSMSENLLVDPVEVARVKAALRVLDNRLKGCISDCEQ